MVKISIDYVIETQHVHQPAVVMHFSLIHKKAACVHTLYREELQQWLTVFQTSLNLHDASIQSPLKGLPKQKAERKDSSSSPHPLKQEPPSCFHGNAKRAPKEMEIEEPNQRSKVKGLSYKTLSTEEVDSNTVKRVSGAKTRQPVVSELDSEKSPIQLLGFRSLNM